MLFALKTAKATNDANATILARSGHRSWTVLTKVATAWNRAQESSTKNTGITMAMYRLLPPQYSHASPPTYTLYDICTTTIHTSSPIRRSRLASNRHGSTNNSGLKRQMNWARTKTPRVILNEN